MKRNFLLITCLGALLLSACGGDSKLPNPTGKGAVRMINAIEGSPDIFFLIEERALGEVAYKDSSEPSRYDDFDYIFNFDVRYPGVADPVRVASQDFKVMADAEHMFVLTGDITAPTVTVWNGVRREWGGQETVFEARFSHAAASLGSIDVYFEAPGVVPGTNPPVATLAFGDIADPGDYEEGTYVITLTAAGDPNTVYFSSSETSLLPRFAHVITVFDGDGNDTGPVAVRSMTAVGNPLVFRDTVYPPETRFIHAAYTLQAVDIYNDELLTSLITANLALGTATADMPTSLVEEDYFYTPAGSQATILFQQQHAAQDPATKAHIYLVGDTDDWRAVRLRPDRASSSVAVRLRIFQGALNYDVADVYIKDRDEPIGENDIPSLITAYSFPSAIIEFAAGSYDIYLTEQGTKTEISAPFQLDAALGDVVDLIAVDTEDPAVIELLDVSIP